LVRARGVIRAAPWLAVLGVAAGGAGLLLLAALVHGTDVAAGIALLGVAACAAGAAYVLDEESATVTDATPSSRALRTAWRLPVVALPAAVGLGGLALLDGLDPATHWLRLSPLLLGAVAAAVAVAAALRRAGAATPGDLASVLVATSTVLLVPLDPLRRWAHVAPLGDGVSAADIGRTVAMWAAVVVASAVVVAGCTREPAARRSRRHRVPAGG
jgi:hypothetical protein